MSLDKHIYALLESEQERLKAQWQGKIVDDVNFENCESRVDSEDDEQLRLAQYQGKPTPEIGEDCDKCGEGCKEGCKDCDEQCTDDEERHELQQGTNVDNDEELKESLVNDIVENLEDCSEDILDRVADICGITESYAIKYDLLTRINAGLGGCTIAELRRIAKLVSERNFYHPVQNI